MTSRQDDPQDRNGTTPARPRPPRISAVVMDFDGVLTDNRVLVHEDGSESVWCSRADGMGLQLLAERGYALLVISKERNPVVSRRCEKLNVPVLQAVDDKASALRRWLKQSSLELERVAFVGNDINDVECMRLCGWGVAVLDAHPTAARAADFVLPVAGGHGAIRHLADVLLAESTTQSTPRP